MRCAHIVYRTRSEIANFFEEFLSIEPTWWADGEGWSVSVGTDRNGATYAIVIGDCKGLRVAVGKVKDPDTFMKELERLTESYVDPCEVYEKLEKHIISG